MQCTKVFQSEHILHVNYKAVKYMYPLLNMTNDSTTNLCSDKQPLKITA